MDAADDGAEAEEADGVAEAMGDAHLMAGAARPAEEALDAAAPLAVLDVTPGFAALDAAGGQLSRMTNWSVEPAHREWPALWPTSPPVARRVLQQEWPAQRLTSPPAGRPMSLLTGLSK